MGGRRQVVDDFETHLTEAANKCERNRGKFERMAKVLINVKAGVDHLADKLANIKLDREAPIEMSDETVEEVLSQCELKLSKLMSLTHLDSQPGRRQLKIDQAGYEEKMLNKSQSDVRIKLTDQAGDDAEEEDVWNRKHVKYNSEQILEKQQKKNRKKVKGKK